VDLIFQELNPFDEVGAEVNDGWDAGIDFGTPKVLDQPDARNNSAVVSLCCSCAARITLY